MKKKNLPSREHFSEKRSALPPPVAGRLNDSEKPPCSLRDDSDKLAANNTVAAARSSSLRIL